MGKSQSKQQTPTATGKLPSDQGKEKGGANAKAGKNDFWGEVPEITANVCGIIEGEFLITAAMDDVIQRDFAFYHLHNCVGNFAASCTYAIIARPEVKRWRSIHSMNACLDVLKVVQKKSRHFPTLLKYGSVPRLIFGADGEQQEERDPEWKARPIMVISTRKPVIFLSSFNCFSPTGTVPVYVALNAGLGMCRALAALHRAGFISRFVTPYSFGVEAPFTLDGISKNMIILDLCLAKEWPSKPTAHIQFTGTPKYSSVKVHQKMEQQGPADDLISVIYIVAEMISGKLPWRSVKEMSNIRKLKMVFHKSNEFRRLPHEIRTLYCELMDVGGLQTVEHASVLHAFKKAIERKGSDMLAAELPKWLCMPLDD